MDLSQQPYSENIDRELSCLNLDKVVLKETHVVASESFKEENYTFFSGKA